MTSYVWEVDDKKVIVIYDLEWVCLIEFFFVELNEKVEILFFFLMLIEVLFIFGMKMVWIYIGFDIKCSIDLSDCDYV